MLPHNVLGRNQMRKLKVYKGPAHPHESQKPQPLSVDGEIPVVVERVPARTPKPRAPKAKAKTKPPARKPAARKAKPAARKTQKPEEKES